MEQKNMKRMFVAGVAAFALAGSAFAQTTVTTGVAPAEAVVIAPEQRTVIKKYVTEKRVKPITVRERVTVGATLPADVELMAVPGDWGPDLGRYRYVYHDDHVVFVEPSSRRVISILD
jgi:Protein of unknown function (DUF1236)